MNELSLVSLEDNDILSANTSDMKTPEDRLQELYKKQDSLLSIYTNSKVNKNFRRCEKVT